MQTFLLSWQHDGETPGAVGALPRHHQSTRQNAVSAQKYNLAVTGPTAARIHVNYFHRHSIISTNNKSGNTQVNSFAHYRTPCLYLLGLQSLQLCLKPSLLHQDRQLSLTCQKLQARALQHLITTFPLLALGLYQATETWQSSHCHVPSSELTTRSNSILPALI